MARLPQDTGTGRSHFYHTLHTVKCHHSKLRPKLKIRISISCMEDIIIRLNFLFQVQADCPPLEHTNNQIRSYRYGTVWLGCGDRTLSHMGNQLCFHIEIRVFTWGIEPRLWTHLKAKSISKFHLDFGGLYLGISPLPCVLCCFPPNSKGSVLDSFDYR